MTTFLQNALNPTTAAVVASNSPVHLFEPIKIRGVKIRNRLWVSPMCQYSSVDGTSNDWHATHLGSFAIRGAGLIIVEATAVVPEGRISPEDAGLWKDEQIAPLKKIVDFAHSQGATIGIQLAHAGRKASTLAPFRGYSATNVIAGEDVNGWPDNVWGPTDEPWDKHHPKPKELSEQQIQDLVEKFVDATIRAEKAGFDMVEIHGAHGYLIHSFLSGNSNHRKDKYGGPDFENRIRFPLAVTKAVREAWPQEKPLFFRVSATDWVSSQHHQDIGAKNVPKHLSECETRNDVGWNIEQTIEFVKRLKQVGVDLIDTSSAGNSSKQDIKAKPGFQVPFAHQIKEAVPDILVGAVGLITEASQAEDILREKKADAVLCAREFLRDSGFALRSAYELGVDVQWPQQYDRSKSGLRHESSYKQDNVPKPHEATK